ncbi:hypothetical protein DH2020_000867 [Rehmannia glutinosa]|uniref:F-box domain-containing protein n=1 Tax=Rehmannia glutinosa TaxID=99300 RepID=A0ABR0XY62_REHGL
MARQILFPQPPTPSPSFPSLRRTNHHHLLLPDDLLLECLSRVPHSTLPSLPAVCRRWAHLLNSPSFQLLRLRHHHVFHTLFSISISDSALFTATLREQSWKVSSFVPSEESSGGLGSGSAFSLFSHFRLVSIGRKIYIIGRTAMLRCDTWTGTLVPKAGMGILRKSSPPRRLGGVRYSSPVVVPDLRRWRSMTRMRMCGAYYLTRLGGGTDALELQWMGCFMSLIGPSGNEGSACPSRAAGAEAAHVYASSMDLYDVEARGWLRSRAVPGGGCVVAACAADGNVYILSSHAVELSFWKFSASRRSANFGEWCRIKSPLPAQVRLDSTVRFSCVGVGDKVVLVQVVGCIDDLLRRSGRTERG